MATKCLKCGKHLSRCLTCKGTGKFSDWFSSGPCSKCKGTGYLCPDSRHGPYWQ